MTFVRGKSGNPKGRPKGSRNAKTKLAAELCAKMKFDPIQALIEIAQDKGVKVETRAAAAREVAKYVRPQLRAIEHSGDKEGAEVKVIMNLGGK